MYVLSSYYLLTWIFFGANSSSILLLVVPIHFYYYYYDYAFSRTHHEPIFTLKLFFFFQIYILMYKEVPIALKINSMYSKKRLLNIHENIKVLRSPDHMSTGIYYW